jgi:hypothetical protein
MLDCTNSKLTKAQVLFLKGKGKALELLRLKIKPCSTLSALNNPDFRIRALGLQRLNSKARTIYLPVIKNMLRDDNELVRLKATRIVWLLTSDPFGELSELIDDQSQLVKTAALELIATLNTLPTSTLFQAISKKSLNEGEKQIGISTKPPQIEGIFIYGSEDEFKMVRTATINAIYEQALNDYEFANAATPFLIDMFNDEDASLRLNAVFNVHKLNSKWTLFVSDDLVQSVLLTVLDADRRVRHLAYKMMSSLKFTSFSGFKAIASILITNANTSTDMIQKDETMTESLYTLTNGNMVYDENLKYSFPNIYENVDSAETDEQLLYAALSGLGRSHPEFTGILFLNRNISVIYIERFCISCTKTKARR